MSDPKKKRLKKTVRQVEDEFGLDKSVEDIVDDILSVFDDDDDDNDDSTTDDDSDDDFGGGDFGGGGSDDDW